MLYKNITNGDVRIFIVTIRLLTYFLRFICSISCPLFVISDLSTLYVTFRLFSYLPPAKTGENN